MVGLYNRLILFLLFLFLCAALYLKNAVTPFERSVVLLTVGFVSLLYWAFARRRSLSLRAWLRWPLLLLFCYLVLQLTPLPLSVLTFLSPARGALVQSLHVISPALTAAPLSVSPADELFSLFTVIGCLAVFLLILSLTHRLTESPWAAVIPLIVVGALEAGLGMLQVFSGGASGTANGTYENRDHFAGLLETVLPFAALYGLALLRRGKSGLRSSPAISALAASALWAIAALMLVAVMYSLSRMGFVAALCGLFVSSVLILAPTRPSTKARWYSLAAVAFGVALFFVLFPPNQLIERFADISSTEQISADTRILLWKETLPLVSEYLLFGCGLGGYEAAFLKHQAVIPQLRANYAHNDYLQYFAELGLVGFLLLAAVVVAILAYTVRGIRDSVGDERRLVLVACMASFAAIWLHSLVDFNSYVPANAFVLAWIAGIAFGTSGTIQAFNNV